jgi:hypothetical protein
LVEFVESPGKRFFVATQAHPEFRSRPARPHPLFMAFIESLKHSKRLDLGLLEPLDLGFLRLFRFFNRLVYLRFDADFGVRRELFILVFRHPFPSRYLVNAVPQIHRVESFAHVKSFLLILLNH